MQPTIETNTDSVFKTKFSVGGGFIVVLLGLAILALFERVLYDTGRLLAPPPLDYFSNFSVITVHTVVVLFFLVIALMANLSLSARKEKYAVALVPYYIVSIILALQLVLQISVYFYNHHTTVEFYVMMIAIVAVATWGMYIVQRRHVIIGE